MQDGSEIQERLGKIESMLRELKIGMEDLAIVCGEMQRSHEEFRRHVFEQFQRPPKKTLRSFITDPVVILALIATVYLFVRP